MRTHPPPVSRRLLDAPAVVGPRLHAPSVGLSGPQAADEPLLHRAQTFQSGVQSSGQEWPRGLSVRTRSMRREAESAVRLHDSISLRPRGYLVLPVRDLRPETLIRECRAVLVIMTTHALIGR